MQQTGSANNHSLKRCRPPIIQQLLMLLIHVAFRGSLADEVMCSGSGSSQTSPEYLFYHRSVDAYADVLDESAVCGR